MAHLLPTAVLLLIAAPIVAQPRLDADGDALPDGARARMGSQRFRPAQYRLEGGNVCVALTPDGKSLATGETGGIRFWDIQTGQETRFIPMPIERVDSLQFDSSGKRFAVVADPATDRRGRQALYVGDVDARKIIWDASGPSPPSRGFGRPRFAVRDSVLVVGELQESLEGPGRVRFFDVERGREHDSGLLLLNFAISPDGGTLAGGTGYGEVILFDIAERKQRRIWKALGGPIGVTNWSPDGKLLAVGGGVVLVNNEHQGDLRNQVWEVASGKRTFEVKMAPGLSWGLGFSPDSRLLVSHGIISRKEVHPQLQTRIWELEKGKELWRDGDKPAWAPASTNLPDGTRINFALRKGVGEADLLQVRAETAAKRELWSWWARGAEAGLSVFSCDGTMFVSSRGQELHVLDLRTGRDRAKHGGHRTAIEELRFAPDGSFLLSIDANRFARLWRPTGARLEFPDDETKTWAGVRILNSGPLLFVGEDGSARVWDAAARQASRALPIEKTSFFLEEGAGRNSAFDVTGTARLAIHVKQGIELWDILAGQRHSLRKESIDNEKIVTFSQDGQYLITTSPSDDSRLYKVVGNKLRPWRKDLWGNGGSNLQFSPDSKWCARFQTLVRGGPRPDDEDPAGPVRLRLHELAGPKQLDFACNAFRFANDNSLLATIDNLNVVHLWQFPSATELKRMPFDSGCWNHFADRSLRNPENVLPLAILLEVHSTRFSLLDVISGRTLVPSYQLMAPIVFSPDGRLIAVGGGSVVLFEAATGREVAKLPPGHRGPVTALAFAADGKTLATGGAEGTILTWDWPAACRLLPKEPVTTETAWNDLSAIDAGTAFRAIFALGAMPNDATTSLRSHLKPASADDARRIRDLIRKLDDDKFRQREAATAELAALGLESAPFLRAALKEASSAESEKRIKQLLADPRLRHYGPEALRSLRAVQILELIGTSETQGLLRELANGAAGMIVTEEARKRVAQGAVGKSK
jgi:WD40 repeat protein